MITKRRGTGQIANCRLTRSRRETGQIVKWGERTLLRKEVNIQTSK